MQENRNKDHKAAIKAMGANKTEKAVHRATKAASGQRQIVEIFDEQTGSHPTIFFTHTQALKETSK